MKPEHETNGELTYQDVLAILDVIRRASRFDRIDVTVDGMSIYAAARERTAFRPRDGSPADERMTSVVTAPAIGVLYWDSESESTVVPGQAPAGRIATLDRITNVLPQRDGVVVEVLAGHGTFVEYGQPLLRIEHT